MLRARSRSTAPPSPSTAGSVEQFLAVSGGLCNNGNGRDKPATKAIFNSPEGSRSSSGGRSMYDEGILGNYGRTTVDTRNAFLAGRPR